MTMMKFTHHRVGVSSDHRRKKGSSHPLRARCASIAVLRRRGLVQRRPRPARVIHCLKNLLDSFGALKSNQREISHGGYRGAVPVFGAHDRAQGYVVRDANARWRLTGGRLSSHQGVAVADIFVQCPRTGTPISTGLRSEWVLLKSLPRVPIPVHCPACGQTHTWDAQDAWIGPVLRSRDPRRPIGSRATSWSASASDGATPPKRLAE